ncbi:MAG: 2,3-bisphosphoglycerate-independent phosphoglycerate mutase [Patescibacteria group bacterium]
MATHPAPIKRISKGPVVVVVWDGFGISKATVGNPTIVADMPVWKSLNQAYPHTVLNADGEAVGLPAHQPGNSEAGHATIGAGRPALSDHVVINRAIDDTSFFDNKAVLQAAANCIRNKSSLHLMGLLTNARSGHAAPKHLKALIEFAKGLHLPRVALHLFTDGRDTGPFYATHLLDELEKQLPPTFTIASVMGRFYAMDRNRYWDRTLLAYDAIAAGRGLSAESPVQAITRAYSRGESDEFILPTVICRNKTCVAPVMDRDSIIFWNLRSDRARQLTKPFVVDTFEEAEPAAPKRSVRRKDLYFVTLTEFGTDLDDVVPAYPHREVDGTLVEALRYSHQLYAAESEKFSQVTYFLNGGFDRPRFNEDRIRVPSPRIARYDDRPALHAAKLARRVSAALGKGCDFALINFANADLIGHTGNYKAGIKACEALDEALGILWKKVHAMKGTLIVTADHGNVERMIDASGGADTEHNMSPVPFLVAGSHVRGKRIRKGTLADVAPTSLCLLGIQKPKEMTGRCLLT